MISLLERFDPRAHVTATLAWTIFAMFCISALVVAQIAADAAQARARADMDQLLAQFARQAHRGLDDEIGTRLAMVDVAATQIAASGDRSATGMRRHIEAIKRRFAEFEWLGVTDARGNVIAAVGGRDEGRDASTRAWFADSQRDRIALGDLRDRSGSEPAGRAAREIEIGVPIVAADGTRIGVLGARLAWSWVEAIRARLQQSFDRRRPVELLLAASDGTILGGPSDGPPTSRRTSGAPYADLAQGGAYLVQSSTVPRAGEAGRIGWSTIVRQRAEYALADAQSVRRAVFSEVLVGGMLAALAAILVTRRVLARLVRLADHAAEVQRGAREDLPRPAGRDEIARVGGILADTVARLQQEKAALRLLNTELDARVVARTARIERLADEQKHAAVVRERLRLARDLHDTLAQSLMALLTQIRLVRKLHTGLAPPELDAELAQAEQVAASGLAEARAAITQMRHNAVRDSGLGAALSELLERFSQRTGIEHTLQVDAQAGAMAGERAETAFRIVEEALNNTARHARADRVNVSLSSRGDGASGVTRVLHLEVEDDGVGFDAASPVAGHYGLRGMREQAALIQARLRIDSAPGAGTRVVLDFEE